MDLTTRDGKPIYLAYLRVSTAKQEASGLGIEAQRASVKQYMKQIGGLCVGEYTETESGTKSDRPELRNALGYGAKIGAGVVVARLDRIARNVRLFLEIIEADVPVFFCDLPQIPPGPTGKMLLTILAAFAEFESNMISKRTKDAMAAAKARGEKRGWKHIRRFGEKGNIVKKEKANKFARKVERYICAAEEAGCKSLDEIARALHARGVPNASGGRQWNSRRVHAVLRRCYDMDLAEGKNPPFRKGVTPRPTLKTRLKRRDATTAIRPQDFDLTLPPSLDRRPNP